MAAITTAMIKDLRDSYLINSREHGQLRARDIEVVDTTDSLRERYRAGEVVHIPDDGHWNAAGNRVAFENRPLHRRNAAVSGQQRWVVTNAAQPRACQCFVTHACVGVRGNDEIGAFGNGFCRNDLGVVQHMQGNAGSARSHSQTIVVSRRHDAGELNAFFVAGTEFTAASCLVTVAGIQMECKTGAGTGTGTTMSRSRPPTWRCG